MSFKQTQMQSDTLPQSIREMLGEQPDFDKDSLKIGENLSDTQKKAFEKFKKGESLLVLGPGGVGKCFSKNTPMLMFDGAIKMVQNIKIGDILMGDDSTPRNVLTLGNGRDTMYKITNVKGENYTVNSEHIICLKYTNKKSIIDDKKNKRFRIRWFNNKDINIKSKYFSYNNKEKDVILKNAKEFLDNVKEDRICEISVKKYLELEKNMRKDLKGYSVPINYSEKELEFDPYIIGLWLGDGTSNSSCITNQDSSIIHYLKNNLQKYNCYLQFNNNTEYNYRINGDKIKGKQWNVNQFLITLKKYNLLNNKHIPFIYKCNSRENRLKLLAGLIDSDGYLNKSGSGYEFSQSLKHEQIIDDIIYLCRSLGFSCYKNKKKTSWTYLGVKNYGEAWRICISGEGLEEIPVMCPRKKANSRKQIKDVLVSGITIEELPEDNYYGFMTDGNERFVLGNFIVTHNSKLVKIMQEYNLENDNKNMHITATTGIASYHIKGSTINSFMGIGTGDRDISFLVKRVFRNKQIVERLRQTDILVIDEISMLSASLFEKINLICQHFRKNKTFMGGIQVIFTGDLMQLLAIFNQNHEMFTEPEDTRLIIESKQFNNKFNNINDNIIVLNKNFRQLNDQSFINMLLRIRTGNQNEQDISKLKNKCENFNKELKVLTNKKITPVHLVTINKKAQIINETNLKKLPGKEYIFKAEFNSFGNSNECKDILKRELNSQFKQKGLIELSLKIGARVMLIKNLDVSIGLINGAIGTITSLNNNSINVLFDNGQHKIITQVDWDLEMNNNIVRAKQIPVILAYALTVHKTQSLTLDYAILDISDAFCDGQIYVALSRLCSFEGLLLKSFNPDKIKVNPKMKTYLESLN